MRSETRIDVPSGPGMQIFSPDGQYGYICSSFTAETVVVSVADHRIVGRVPQQSPFCPDIAATPDGKQVWFTLKDVGKVSVFDARPPFRAVEDDRDGAHHQSRELRVQRARADLRTSRWAASTEVQVFRTDDFSRVATIPVGKLPHGLWPAGDGSRMYVGLENADQLIAIDTATHKVIGAVPDRASAASSSVCAERGAGWFGHAALGAARRRRRDHSAHARATPRSRGEQPSDERDALRPRPDASAAGLRDRPRAQAPVRARAFRCT